MRQQSVHYAYVADPDALTTLFERMGEGGPYEDLHAASHPAWLERAEVCEAALGELFDLPAMRAQLMDLHPSDPEQAEWAEGARTLLARTETLHLWRGYRDRMVAQLERLERLVEMGAPPIIIDHDRLMLARLMAEAEQRTNPAPPATPIRLFIESLRGEGMSLMLPWLVTFPAGGSPLFAGLDVVPARSGGQWRLMKDCRLVHGALLAGQELVAWADAIERQELDPALMRAHAIDWLALDEPGAPLEVREEEGASRLEGFLRADLCFLASRFRDAAAEAAAVLTWSVALDA